LVQIGYKIDFMSSGQTISGQIRRKREDTLIKNIEKKYGVDFNVRGDMRLGTYLEEKGLPSLSKALERATRHG
jgi:hypothetical protein